MKAYEKESLFKNFMVFFLLLELLLILLFLQIYHNSRDDYHKELLHKMQLCSYFLKCNKFKVTFEAKKKKDLNKLYTKLDGVDAFFYIPKSKKYDMRLHYPIGDYNKDIDKIFKMMLYKFIAFSILLSGVAIIFTLYSLNPIRKALKLNDEFIKDILHDFNTPIASIVLNIEMFNDENEEDIYIKKISQSLNNILQLQDNLTTFLHHSPSQMSMVDINSITKERLEFIQSIYPKIRFEYQEISYFKTITNKELLIRIIDNILSNAFKYNRPKGLVIVTIDKYEITIKDTGKGIKDTNKIFQRYYTEQERGIGLGLHIVQKLTQELNLKLTIETEIDKGTEVTLYFPKKDIFHD